VKRLAPLVVLAAFALPCAASDPGRIAVKKPPPGSEPSPHYLMVPAPKLLDTELVQTILFPERALSRWALDQVGIGPHRQFSGNVIGLQAPGNGRW
jgi:hypothetical protein